mmetsp:Transcript_30838/g.64971  ORF Transcript_30838/g.64971 Transcript_30838/m.64971 type:complete len:94 (+) Transcript_30838:140-421(+)
MGARPHPRCSTLGGGGACAAAAGAVVPAAVDVADVAALAAAAAAAVETVVFLAGVVTEALACAQPWLTVLCAWCELQCAMDCASARTFAFAFE